MESQKTAERVGFKNRLEYYGYFACYDKYDTYLQNGYNCLYTLKQPGKAKEFFDLACSSGKNEMANLYNIARAFSINREINYALEYLNKVLVSGWTEFLANLDVSSASDI